MHSSVLDLFLICSILYTFFLQEHPWRKEQQEKGSCILFTCQNSAYPSKLAEIPKVPSPCNHLLHSEANSFLRTGTILHFYIFYNTSCIAVVFLLVLTISRLIFLRPKRYKLKVFYASWSLVLRLS